MTGRGEGGVGDALVMAVDRALTGERRALWAFLARASHLPGPRANERLMEHFAEVAAGRGRRADDVVVEMATLDADIARGGTEYEFVPMCGVLAVGARAATHDKAYS